MMLRLESFSRSFLKMKDMKSWIAILMGIIILIADLYWLFGPGAASYTVPIWLALGIIILIADLVWLGIDYSFMKEAGKPKSTTAQPGPSA